MHGAPDAPGAGRRYPSGLPAASPAVVAHAAGDLRIESIPLPAPLPHQAVVEIAYGGICGSDLHYWLHGAAGESVLKAPMVLGHEIVGTVIRAAADGSGPAEGAQVAVHPATPGPGEGPDYARYPEDRPNLSPGCTYLGSAARFPHTDGAFSRYVNLPSRMLRVLPPGLDLRTAALIEPASVAWHAVARAAHEVELLREPCRIELVAVGAGAGEPRRVTLVPGDDVVVGEGDARHRGSMPAPIRLGVAGG